MPFNSARLILIVQKCKRLWACSALATPQKCRSQLQFVVAQLAFANSDLAFRGKHLFQGNFYGVNIFDISNPAKTKLVTSMVCPGGQGDVSVYKNLMFMSVEMPNGRLDCSITDSLLRHRLLLRKKAKKANRRCLRQVKNDFAASEFSIFPTSKAPNKSRQCKPVAARTRIRW